MIIIAETSLLFSHNFTFYLTTAAAAAFLVYCLGMFSLGFFEAFLPETIPTIVTVNQPFSPQEMYCQSVVRQEVAKAIGWSASQVCLSFNGCSIGDRVNVARAGIQCGDTLHVAALSC